MRNKILDSASLAAWANAMRNDGRKVVLTNGCFDLLHAGHIRYLAGAKALGGVLIGLLEALVVGYISPTYRDAIVFGVLILILLVKPTGLLGASEREKV